MSPRQKLLNNKNLADAVQKMVDGEVFDTAADAALLQYIENIPPTAGVEDHASAYNRIQGAKEFLKVLRTIADRPKTAPARLPDNLDHKA